MQRCPRPWLRPQGAVTAPHGDTWGQTRRHSPALQAPFRRPPVHGSQGSHRTARPREAAVGQERASWAPAPPPPPPQPLPAQVATGHVTAGSELLAEGHVTGWTQPLRGDLLMKNQTQHPESETRPRSSAAGQGRSTGGPRPSLSRCPPPAPPGPHPAPAHEAGPLWKRDASHAADTQRREGSANRVARQRHVRPVPVREHAPADLPGAP